MRGLKIKVTVIGDGSAVVLPVGEAVIRWKRMAAAGVMELFTPDQEAALRCGLEVKMAADGEEIFCGYIFSVESAKEGRRLTVCDSLRYLLCRDTKVYAGKTVGEIVREICGERGLSLAACEDGGIAIPSLIADRETLLDIVSRAIDEQVRLGGEKLILIDDAGSLRLLREEGLQTGLTLSGKDMLSRYEAESGINLDTYNRVQLVRKNRKSGLREIFMKEDAEAVRRWGVLQYTENVLQSATNGEIEKRLEALLKEKCRSVEKLSVEAVGDIRCRAGFLVRLGEDMGALAGEYRITEAVHRMLGGGYTMQLKLERVV